MRKKNNEVAVVKDMWQRLWNEIYEFQDSLPVSLPDGKEALRDLGLVPIFGRGDETLYVTEEILQKMHHCRMVSLAVGVIPEIPERIGNAETPGGVK